MERYEDGLEKYEAETERIKKYLNVGHEMLYLTKEDCMKVGPDIDETLEIVKKTLIDHGNKNYEMPAKIGIHPFTDVHLHAMPAYLPEQFACGMKWISCFPRNPRDYGIPQTSALTIMNDVLTGYPIALMDAGWATAMRTPAVTANAAKVLHPDARTVGMYGCGVQGKGHVQFFDRVYPNLEKIYVYARHEESMDNLIKVLQPKVNAKIVKGESIEQVAKECEVLSSATIVTRDILNAVKPEWVGKGQTILPADLNSFFDQRIPQTCDKYIVDGLNEHKLLDEMGYFPQGLPKVYAETGEIVAGLKPGRESKDELIVCSNTGLSVMDMAMGIVIMNKALEMGVGIKLPL